MQKFKIIPTNIFSLTDIQIINTFSTQSCFFEMHEKFITKWGNFDKLQLKNGVNFVVKCKKDVRICMTLPSIKQECFLDNINR